MATVLVASSKGGCGKSTLVTQLADYWAQKGQHVVIVDADRRRSILRWLAREGCRKALERLPADADQARTRIDTAAGARLRDLEPYPEPYLEASQAALVPVLPCAFDLDATLDFLQELAGVAAVRRGKLPVGLVANRLKPWTHSSHDAVAEPGQHSPFPVVAQLRDKPGLRAADRAGQGHLRLPVRTRSQPSARLQAAVALAPAYRLMNANQDGSPRSPSQVSPRPHGNPS